MNDLIKARSRNPRSMFPVFFHPPHPLTPTLLSDGTPQSFCEAGIFILLHLNRFLRKEAVEDGGSHHHSVHTNS